MMVEYKLVPHDGLGLTVGRCMVMFYADDGLFGLKKPEWIQGALKMLIGLLRWYILVPNISNSKAMMCLPGEIWSGMSEEALGRKITWRGATYKERLRHWITCPYFGVDLTAWSMTAHRRRMQSIDPEINCN